MYIILPIILLTSFDGFCQDEENEKKTDLQLMNAAREIMTSASTCALITLDQEGRSRARAMDAFAPESDFTVWFGTNPKSRKVAQIKNDPRVTLYYLGNDDSGYVLIYGVARIIDDENEKEKRWKDEWEEFYPEKDKGYILIKVSPEWMEVVSYPHGLIGDPETWKPHEVEFDPKK